MGNIFKDCFQSIMKQKKVKAYSTKPLKAFMGISIILIILLVVLLCIDKPDIESLFRYDNKFTYKMQAKGPAMCY